MEITPSAKDIRETQAAVHDEMGLDLTLEQALEILNDPHVAGEVASWGVYDTETRGAIANFLAKKIVGRPWPLYGDGEEVAARFKEDLTKNARALGYKVIASDPGELSWVYCHRPISEGDAHEHP